MTSEHIIDFKRGDTFELGGQVLGADDIPIDITNYVIKAQVRDKARLVGDAVVTKVVAANGEYKARINNTILWPTKDCLMMFSLLILAAIRKARRQSLLIALRMYHNDQNKSYWNKR